MAWRHVLCPVAIVLTATSAAAQTVTVRSGDHDTFTRLVLSIPAGTDWTTESRDTGTRIALGTGIGGFDTTGVFARIDRSRIAALDATDGTLDVTVACACHVAAFLFRPDMLVVDVIDGADPDAPAVDPEVDVAEPAPPRAAQGRPVPFLPVIPAATAPVPLLPDTFAGPAVAPDDLSQTERAILESFARAASQGLFDFSGIAVPLGPDGQPVATNTGLSPVPDPQDGVPLPQRDGDVPRPGLVLRTGIARDDPGAVPVDAGAPACARLGPLDTAGWIDAEGDFFDQIADGRLALTTETGRVVPEAVLAQARRYVAFGFGLEAVDTLRLLGLDDEVAAAGEVRSLRTLAAIVDGGIAPDSALARGADCGPDAAVWAVLARGNLDGFGEAERDAALVGYRDLSDSLRGHLGIRLAGLFSEAGEHLIATDVLDTAGGKVTGRGLDADLARADLDGAEHGADAEIGRLGAIAARNPRMAPETLVRLLDLTADEGQSADPSVLELAEALRHDTRGESVEADLAQAETRALIVAGDFAGALGRIDETSAVLGADAVRTLTDDAIMALAARADDTGFLDLALGMPPDDLSADVQNAVAARLLSLGFPDLAQPYLWGNAERDDMRERRYLRAAAAAALGDTAGVETALEGMTDARAQAIRADGRIVTGDFTGAYAARDPTDAVADAGAAPDGAAGAAWRAGDWTGLETSGDALLSDASRAILSPPPPPGDGTPLADRRTLLDEVENTRALTQALLERFVVEPSDGD